MIRVDHFKIFFCQSRERISTFKVSDHVEPWTLALIKIKYCIGIRYMEKKNNNLLYYWAMHNNKGAEQTADMFFEANFKTSVESD